jgi:alkyl sulfatase BDS1-like metallo-beta-lactamase superfamily hydrolase
MLEPWSDAWIAAADAAARADAGLVEASRGRRVVIGQEVVDGERRNRWHMVLDDGVVAVRPGPAEAPDVTFSQDRATAEAVARGELPARTAFVLGRIRVGGDVSVLLDLAPALAGLGDVFGAVRPVGAS